MTRIARISPVIALAVACGGGTSALPPKGQLLLYFDTDAPLPPRAAGPRDLGAPLPLFDRLRVEVYSPDAPSPCAGCTNDFAVDAELFAARAASIGVPLPPGRAGYLARVRLYAARFVGPSGEPDADAAIDRWLALPANAADGVVELTAMLTTDAAGSPGARDAPIAPTPGKPGRSMVGTWIDAPRVACAGDPAPGRACVPGGAFWMGSQDDDRVLGRSAGWHRLVVLSPFFIDAHEVTVAEFRPSRHEATPWSGSKSGYSSDDWCTFTASPGPRDAMPVNCVTYTAARNFCKDRGGDLPTEAQFEYVTTALGASRFVWGADEPSCTDAIWARGGFGFFSSYLADTCLSAGKALAPLGGPELPGSADEGTGRDWIDLGGVHVVDLIGNVGEWSRDRYTSELDPCWSAHVLDDPVCEPTSATQTISARGGTWLSQVFQLRAEARVETDPRSQDPAGGMRCVYDVP